MNKSDSAPNGTKLEAKKNANNVKDNGKDQKLSLIHI